jgi:nicotinate-nucleotide pyrophosphorylase (carboxylating)
VSITVPDIDIRVVDKIVKAALDEDIGYCDLTTEAVVNPNRRAVGDFVAENDGIICGLVVAQRAFKMVDDSVVFEPFVCDGAEVSKGDVFARVTGSARSILKAERVSLNFLQHMSGIATLTRTAVEKVRRFGTIVTDTRKTTPGLRALQKYAVRCGGGQNHRFGLFDGVLIKDNHIAVAGSIAAAVEAARSRVPHTVRIEVEVETHSQVEEALEAGADIIMLDNMGLDDMADMAKLIGGRALVEASGGITCDRLETVAAAGVDIISMGCLTHSSRSLDLSLDIRLGETSKE